MKLVQHKPSGLRAAGRLIKLCSHIVTGCGTVVVSRLRHGPHWYHAQKGADNIRVWMQKACDILGVRVFTTGDRMIRTDALLIANHVSWLDIIALHSITHTRFLSKDTLRYWPVIGWLTASVGTLFIRRGRRFVMNAVINSLRQELKAGRSVVVFPEGTTTDGRAVKPFHAGLLEVASRGDKPVQALALRYYRNGEIDRFAPYIDNDNFVMHLWRIAALPETMLLVHVFSPLNARQLHRRELAQALRADIEGHLNGVSFHRVAA